MANENTPDTRTAIFQVIRDSADPVNVADLVAKTGFGKSTVQKHVKDMVENGAVLRADDKRLTAAPVKDKSKTQVNREEAARRDEFVLGLLRGSEDGIHVTEVAKSLENAEFPEQPNGKGRGEYISLWRLRKNDQAYNVGRVWHAERDESGS